jgi:hypothetical protein
LGLFPENAAATAKVKGESANEKNIVTDCELLTVGFSLE